MMFLRFFLNLFKKKIPPIIIYYFLQGIKDYEIKVDKLSKSSNFSFFPLLQSFKIKWRGGKEQMRLGNWIIAFEYEFR